MRLIRVLLVLAVSLGVAGGARAAHTEARLVLAAETARAGETVMAGLHLKMEEGWHTYWRNGGDAGAATRIDWTLPTGVTAGEIQWPVPEKQTDAGLTSYFYEKEVVLLIPLKLAVDVASGPLDLQAKASWLECEKLCVPGKATVVAKFTVGAETKVSAGAALIDVWTKKLPRIDPALAVNAAWDGDLKDGLRPLTLEWAAAKAGKNSDFYPYESSTFTVKGETEWIGGSPERPRLRKRVEKLEGDWPKEIAGLLVTKGEPPVAYEVRAPIAGGGLTASDAVPTTAAGTGEKKPLLFWMLYAFLGGLILNVMPCVLPVIALKILGFVQQAREAPGQVRKLGLIYALGVLASFLVLAGVIIGVKQAGKLVSWGGLQFGNPIFLVTLMVIVTLVALNLFGLFEITLAGGLMGAAGDLSAKEGAAGAFFNGVLAVALATPCTAPFLGASMGFALAQSSGVIVLMFLTVGLGLAAPYVVLSWQPAWLKFLPRPGVWMERFKIAMGFPMLATAVWLFTLTQEHYEDLLWLGFFLVLVALAAWVYGEFVQRGRQRRGLALGIVVLLLSFGYGYGLEHKLDWRTRRPQKVAGDDEIIKEGPDGIEWRRWSAAAVQKARAAGRPVFVDFTARWCTTCLANKNYSIEIPATRAKLKEINAVALLADYTKVPDVITEELLRFGRAGVPLVLVYPKDTNKPPEILPEWLGPPNGRDIVLQALERAAK